MRRDDLADTGRGDEQAVGGATLHDLGVTGDDLDRRLGGGGRHAGADLVQAGDLETLLDDEGGGQTQGPGRRRGQVVDRAGHRQAADVAAGEGERLHDVGVGGEGDPSGSREGGGIV